MSPSDFAFRLRAVITGPGLDRLRRAGGAALLTALVAAVVPASAASAAPAVGWTALADCAAAYQANAQISDPDRPAAMTAQISDVAGDYAKAAAAAFRRQAGRGAGRSTGAVTARVARQTKAFAAQPREAVEKVIDACPQLAD